MLIPTPTYKAASVNIYKWFIIDHPKIEADDVAVPLFALRPRRRCRNQNIALRMHAKHFGL